MLIVFPTRRQTIHNIQTSSNKAYLVKVKEEVVSGEVEDPAGIGATKAVEVELASDPMYSTPSTFYNGHLKF